MTSVPDDRAWLWRLHGLLAVTSTHDGHHTMRRDLLDYLRRTCTHFWDHIPAAGQVVDPHEAVELLQCRYCQRTKPRRAATVPGATGGTTPASPVPRAAPPADPPPTVPSLPGEPPPGHPCRDLSR